MNLNVARLGGVILALGAVVVGILAGRVIEAIAAAVVLAAVWVYALRLVLGPDEGVPDRGERGSR